MKIGLIREGKIPVDTRVALPPWACTEVKNKFPFVDIAIQRSLMRCYKDSEYEAAGFAVQEDVSDCDVLIGIKEVPVNELVQQKTYFFFSHTIKQQPYNRNLLISLLNKKIRMIDYETITNAQGARVIAFGRFAGLVGAYNGLIAYGKRHALYDLKPAHKCFDLAEMMQECKKVRLPGVKIAVTGSGRVANGTLETLQAAGIRQVGIQEYLTEGFEEPVFVQLQSKDYHLRKSDGGFSHAEFHASPELYHAHFAPFTQVTDLLIASAYWNPKAPVLFTREDMKSERFRMRVIADVTCDINGSIPSTVKPSTIDDPFYDYNPHNEHVEPAFCSDKNITVMAIDNLPNELPRDASDAFARQLIDNVFPALLVCDQDLMIERATIAIDGKLTPKYSYLQHFADGKA